MIGTKELCALLLAGGMGASSVVAVQKQRSPKPPVAAKAKGKGVGQASRPRVVRPEPAQPAPRILDCPVTGSPFAAVPVPGFDLPAPPSPFGAVALGQPGAGGVWDGPNTRTPPTFPPAVPEPDTWLLWIAGFGFVGLSLRSRKATA